MNATAQTKFFGSIAPVVSELAIVGAALAVTWSFTWGRHDIPTKTQGQFVGLVIVAAVAIMLAVWTAASRNPLAWAGGLVSGSVGLGLWLYHAFGFTRAGVTWALVTTAAVVFFTLLVVQNAQEKITREKMRNAIAGSFTVTYLAAVGLVVFFRESANNTLPKITSTLVTSFTQLMIVVIGFYFGGVTAEKLSALKALAKNADKAAVAKLSDE